LAKLLKVVGKTELNKPVLLAGWPGMGHVALKILLFLHEALRAQDLAVLERPEFFQVAGVTIQNGVIQATLPPRSGFYYWKRKGPSPTGDLLLFIGDQQPVPGKEYELAKALLAFSRSYGVEEVFTAAAMPSSINHYQESRVWVTATETDLLNQLSPYCHRVLNEGHVSGMNGLLLGVAKQQGMRGACFLGEIPFYTTEIENPKASMAVLQVLSKVLHLKLNLEELEELAQHTEKEIDRYLLALEQREKEEEKQANEPEGPVTVH